MKTLKAAGPRRRAVVTTVVAVVTLMALGAAPADAATGNGTSVGTYTINNDLTGQGICSVVYDYTYQSGTGYTGTYSSGGASYTGALSVAWAAAKNYTYNGGAVVGFENPAGHFQDPACTIPAGPWTIAPNITVTGSNATGSVSCTYPTGTHDRDVAVTTTTFSGGTCTVTQGGTSSTTTTNEVHAGEVLDCGEGMPPTSCNENDTWVAAGA